MPNYHDLIPVFYSVGTKAARIRGVVRVRQIVSDCQADRTREGEASRVSHTMVGKEIKHNEKNCICILRVHPSHSGLPGVVWTQRGDEADG